MFNWLSRKNNQLQSDRQLAERSCSEFLALLLDADRRALALTAVEAADVASRLYTDTNGEVDLRTPRKALNARASLVFELTEAVQQLQRAGRQTEAPGTIMWVNTLWAESMPELRPKVREMWSLVDKGGFLFADETVRLLEDQTGRSLSNNVIFRIVPEGFGD